MKTEEPIVSGMAGRYATALFELALEGNALDQVQSDVARFSQLLDGSEDLVRLVRSPVFTEEQQSAAISEILTRLQVSELTARFFNVVIENRRLFAIRDMIVAFRALLADYRGEITASVVSAQPLQDAQKAKLQSTLRGVYGRTVDLNVSVDPKLIGGLIVKVGSRMVDASLATQLNNIQLAMREV